MDLIGYRVTIYTILIKEIRRKHIECEDVETYETRGRRVLRRDLRYGVGVGFGSSSELLSPVHRDGTTSKGLVWK